MRKGFTLIEMLVVIFIIGILFVALLGMIGDQTNKAKEAGLKDDMRVYMFSVEHLMRSNSGFRDKVDIDNNFEFLNDILREEYQLTHVTGTDPIVVGESNKEDPWGTKYRVEFISDTKDGKRTDKIFIKSYGKEWYWNDEKDTEINNNTLKPNYVMLTQNFDGHTISCTAGLPGDINSETSNADSVLNSGTVDFENLDCLSDWEW